MAHMFLCFFFLLLLVCAITCSWGLPLKMSGTFYVKPLVMMISVLQDGWSPLMIASEKGNLDVVKTLIEAGANVNHSNKVGVCIYNLVVHILYYHSSASLCTYVCVQMCKYRYICHIDAKWPFTQYTQYVARSECRGYMLS